MGYDILFLTPEVPYPLFQGTALRNFGLIKGLSERGHTITLITFGDDTKYLARTPLPALCKRIITVPLPQRSAVERLLTLLTGQADLATRLESKAMHSTLAREVSKLNPDIVHIEGLEMAPFMDRITGPKRIYDAHNAEHILQKRIAEQSTQNLAHHLYSRVQASRLRQYEQTVCEKSDMVFACSAEDAAHLNTLAPQTPKTIIPNAIDINSYAPDGPTAELPQPALVFTGKMDYRPNVDAALWFANSILPHILKDIPDATFVIVGQKPHLRLDSLRDRPDIIITGWVEDIQTYIRGAAVYVAPLRMGSGTRFKLLETMALGKPIVSTSVGAEGLAVADGTHMRLADIPETFAQAVTTLLQTRSEWEWLTANARRYVQAHYDWSVVIPQVEVAYSALMG